MAPFLLGKSTAYIIFRVIYCTGHVVVLIFRPAFFFFRFTSPPTLQKITRHKIKIPIIYFFYFRWGDLYVRKVRNGELLKHAKNGKCQFYFYIYYLFLHQEFVRDCRKTKLKNAGLILPRHRHIHMNESCVK